MSVQQDIATLTARCEYNETAKAAFHRVAKKYLRRLAATLALPKGSYSIHSNQGGIAVSGEVTLHSEHLHLWVEQSCIGSADRVVWYRGCHGQKDYTGMVNHAADASELVDTPRMADLCRAVIAQAEATDKRLASAA
ncbi:MAG: hypothetical protein EPN36_14300 [Rhodanobacteraceae bacterium]|nr:MAG: hypothetical protein EPN36_14300 [Rhodanobacteraceae bacterium]